MAESKKELNDMKYNMLDLKKKVHCVSSENYVLKVKVRKLEAELEKKNKHIESLINPNKSSCVRKILTERGASLIVDLKKRNCELIQAIESKDAYIKKIQTELQTSKTYLPSDLMRNKSANCRHKSLKSTENIPEVRINSSRSRSLSVTPTPRNIFKMPTEVLVTKHLEKNIEKIKLACVTNSSIKGRPFSDNNNAINAKKNISETCFNELLNEVENMKGIVYKLSLEQEHTRKLIKEKNRSIEFLARQVKQLQKNKFKKSGGTIVLQISNNKNENIETKLNTSSYSQESFEEDEDSKNTRSKINESDNEDDDDVETGDTNT